MKSSMFTLWVITAVLSYAQKLPYIKQIIGALSLIYGRTTVWKVLIKLRKAFIMFNAIIGVYMVFKTVGFNYENVLAGFVGMGNSYLEIFTNFSKRLFHWFVELFDHKVIPNVSGDTGGNSITKRILSNGPIDKSVFNPFSSQPLENSLRKSYNSLLNLNVDPVSTAWYRDVNNLWWLAGLVAKGAAIAGVLYFGYKFVIDPLFINDLNIKGKGVDLNPDNVVASSSISVTSPEGSITPTGNNVDGSIALHAFRTTLKGISKTLKKLNPSYWLLTGDDTSPAYQRFVNRQWSTDHLNQYFPYSSYNPFDPLSTRLRLYFFGVNIYERTERLAFKQSLLNSFIPVGAPETPLASGSSIIVSASHATTPLLSTLGLSLDPAFISAASKVASLPPTPGLRVFHLMGEDPMPSGFADAVGDAVSRLTTNTPPLAAAVIEDLDDVVAPVREAVLAPPISVEDN